MRAYRTIARLLPLGLVLLAACGGRKKAVELEPDNAFGTRWNGRLATPAELVGAVQIRGDAWMGQGSSPGETRTEVTLSNAAPGGEHPWHVHEGTCGSNGGVLGPGEAYKTLKVGGDGRASQSTTLPMALPTSGSYYVNIHASPSNMGTIVACGNLAPPIR